MISACGVVCSDCPAFVARRSCDPAYGERVAHAWHELFGLDLAPEAIRCGGCLGPDEQVFPTSVRCAARRCCRSRHLATCGECPDRPCEDLERAQSVWDETAAREGTLPEGVFEEFCRPYCGARRRVPGTTARS